VTVAREGAENIVAYIADDRFFAKPVTEGEYGHRQLDG